MAYLYANCSVENISDYRISVMVGSTNFLIILIDSFDFKYIENVFIMFLHIVRTEVL